MKRKPSIHENPSGIIRLYHRLWAYMHAYARKYRKTYYGLMAL